MSEKRFGWPEVIGGSIGCIVGIITGLIMLLITIAVVWWLLSPLWA